MRRDLFLPIVSSFGYVVLLGGCSGAGVGPVDSSADERYDYMNVSGSPLQTSWEAKTNREAMRGLSIGMSKSEVIEILGGPRGTESHSLQGRTIESWFYLTSGKTIGDRSITVKNFTPLCFEDGALVGWGRNFYDEAVKHKGAAEIE